MRATIARLPIHLLFGTGGMGLGQYIHTANRIPQLHWKAVLAAPLRVVWQGGLESEYGVMSREAYHLWRPESAGRPTWWVLLRLPPDDEWGHASMALRWGGGRAAGIDMAVHMQIGRCNITPNGKHNLPEEPTTSLMLSTLTVTSIRLHREGGHIFCCLYCVSCDCNMFLAENCSRAPKCP